jgi:hypothetical protein
LDAIPELRAAEAGPRTACDLLAWAAVRAAPEGMPALRQRPGPGAGARVPPAFLKHADEQTVAGLAAVLQAIDRHGLAGTRFTDWGVLGAPRFLGRVALAATMHRFAAEGAWGISPHLIPHRSLHALSGTISQALKIHGPNYGTGGGPRGTDEALLCASSLLASGTLPGVWVACTGWEPEPVPDREGRWSGPAVCHGLALALVAARPAWDGPRLHVEVEGGPSAPEAAAGPVNLERLAAALTASGPGRPPMTWALACGGRLRLTWAGPTAGLLAPHLFARRNGVHGEKEGRGAGPGSQS